MSREELTKELLMGYEEFTEYLKEKYGPAKYDYFCNESCRTVNKKTSRSSEGLQCHHIDEDKQSNLSVPQLAQKNPYDYQRKDRLVYCNLIEHCLLHHKINELRQAYYKKIPKEISEFFSSEGVFHTSGLINDLYVKKGSSTPYLQHYYEAIRDDYDDYIWMIALIMKNLENSYRGEKTPKRIVNNNPIKVYGREGVIKGYTKNSYTIDIQFEDGTVEKIRPRDIDDLSYLDYIDFEIRSFSAGKSDTYYETIYQDILEKMSNNTEEDLSVLGKLKKRTEQLAENSLVYIDGSTTPIDESFNIGKQLVAGERVYDRRYGLGTIVNVEYALGLQSLTINYDKRGIRYISKEEFVERNININRLNRKPTDSSCPNRNQAIEMLSNQDENNGLKKDPFPEKIDGTIIDKKLETFQVGDRVNHRVFGKGVVESEEPLCGDQVVTVRFERAGKKRIMARFSRLEKI